MSVTNRSPFSSNWRATCYKNRSAEERKTNKQTKLPKKKQTKPNKMKPKQTKTKHETWLQYPKKVFPTKSKAWFIKPTGKITHLATCRSNHIVSFLPKKQNSHKARCARKKYLPFPKAHGNKKYVQAPHSQNFFFCCIFIYWKK